LSYGFSLLPPLPRSGAWSGFPRSWGLLGLSLAHHVAVVGRLAQHAARRLVISGDRVGDIARRPRAALDHPSHAAVGARPAVVLLLVARLAGDAPPVVLLQLLGVDIVLFGIKSCAGFYHPAALVIITATLTGIFYSLDALLGERRDRSVLFWKSLPVSDRTTVLSKASIPMAVLPAVAFAATVAMHILLLLIFSVALLIFRQPLNSLWSQLPFFQIQAFVLYVIVTCTLWFAPIYGWLLLVSSISRRAALVWAVLPFVVAVGLERFAFRSEYVVLWLQHRLAGGLQAAFHYATQQHGTVGLKDATPGFYLASPGLWVGLAAFAIFIFLCIRIRRVQGPI